MISFILPAQVIELKNIINQKLADKLISEYPLVHYLVRPDQHPISIPINRTQVGYFQYPLYRITE